MQTKRIILLLALFALTTTAFASTFSYNPSTYQLTYDLKKGWNLVVLGFEGFVPDCFQDPSTRSVAAVYVWLPTTQKYVGGIVTGGQGPDLSQYQDVLLSHVQPAFWVYSGKDCSTTSNAIENPAPQLMTGEGVPKKLARGWNFVAILPWMVGVKGADLFANCNITKANAWNAETQNWAYASSGEAARTLTDGVTEIRNSDVGGTWVVYAESACELAEAAAISPPALPD